MAQEPAARREDARLLVVPRTGPHGHRDAAIPNLRDLLRPRDLLVVNETRVVPARLPARRTGTGGRAEVLLLETEASGGVRVLLGTRGKPRPGETINVAEGALVLTLKTALGHGEWRAGTDADPKEISAVLEAHGQIPLPPYIRRDDDDPRARADRERYQTVYARRDGAVAAPTAGLHLTPELLDDLDARGVRRAAVVLHVGPGTFRPVTAADLRLHPMHEEGFDVPPATAAAIADTRDRGGRIVAVGTTVVRVLESAVRPTDPALSLRTGPGRTTLFVHPPHLLRVCDALLTNFHAPRSTLLMLVAAMAGRERILAAYRHAVRRRYRMLSYGDAMFIA